MTTLEDHLDHLDAERIKMAHQQLDSLGIVDAVELVRPIAALMSQLTMIGEVVSGLDYEVGVDERLHDRAAILVDELDRAANQMMAVVQSALVESDRAMGATIRTIFETVTCLPGMRIDLLNRRMINGDM